MADETFENEIVNRIKVDADQALTQLEELRKRIDAYKASLLEMRATSDESFRVMAQAIKESQGKGYDTKAMQAAIRELNAADAARLKQTQANEQARKQAILNTYDQQKAQIQQNLVLEKQAAAQTVADQKAVEQAERQRYTAKQNQLRQQVQMEKEIEAQAKQTSGSGGTGAFLDNLGGKAGQLTNTLRNLGTAGSVAFGTVLGMLAGTVINNLIGLFGKLTGAVKDFAQELVATAAAWSETMFRFEVSIRALQRVGFKETVGDWLDVVNDLKAQFPIFSRQEITDAVSMTALMTREFGFNAEQMREIISVSMMLSELYNKDLQEAIRGVTYAIGSGYTESLQRMGININKAIIAQEGMRLGFGQSYNEMTNAERALATYNVVLANAQAQMKDAGAAADQLFGKQRKLNAQFEDFKVLLGRLAEPKLINFYTNLNTIFEQVTQTIRDTIQVYAQLTFTLQLLGDWVTQGFGAMQVKMREFGKDVTNTKDLIQSISEVTSQMAYDYVYKPQEALGDEQTGNALQEGVDEERAANIKQSIQDLWKAIVEEQKRGQEESAQLWQDYNADIEELTSDLNAKVQEAYSKYNQEVADLEENYLRDRAKLDADYQDSVTKAAADSAQRRAEAEARYRNNEISAEAKYQERLQQLREKFLMDLEDAIHERDARQALRLIRQYNLEKQQAGREEALRKDDAARDLALQLKTIEQERAARMAELAREHAQREAELQAQYARERLQAQTKFQQELADLKANYDERRKARLAQYEQDQKDLDKSVQDRINKVAAGLVEEYNITTDMAGQIYQALAAYFGPGGAVEGLYNYMYAMITQMQAWDAWANAYFGPGTSWSGSENVAEVPTHSGGGTFVADKPTMAIWGEDGKEYAQFTPARKLDRGQTSSLDTGGNRVTDPVKVALDVLLSPDLEARVVDRSIDRAADVMLKVLRER